jgi:hypothetical protein
MRTQIIQGGKYMQAVNWEYVNEKREVAEQCRPILTNLLSQVSQAWGMGSYVETISSQYFDYGWYIEGNGILIGYELNSDGINPQIFKLELIRRNPQAAQMTRQSGITFSPFEVINTFPLTDDGVNQSVAWINHHGPRWFMQ